MPGQICQCIVCNRQAEYLCALCGGSKGTVFFCADHRCIHFADDIAKELEKANPKPQSSDATLGKVVLGFLAVLGLFAVMGWIGDAGGDASATWGRIAAIIAGLIVVLALFGGAKFAEERSIARDATNSASKSTGFPHASRRASQDQPFSPGMPREVAVRNFHLHVNEPNTIFSTDHWLAPKLAELRLLLSDPISTNQAQALDDVLHRRHLMRELLGWLESPSIEWNDFLVQAHQRERSTPKLISGTGFLISAEERSTDNRPKE